MKKRAALLASPPLFAGLAEGREVAGPRQPRGKDVTGKPMCGQGAGTSNCPIPEKGCWVLLEDVLMIFR